MKILRLEAENFKRLKAVDITPKGNLVQITGRNANGKTSVLDAIWAAVGGAAHLQVQPIRKGATKARIKLDLGEIVVTRQITPKGSTLTVENAEGLAYKSPQRMLDDLVGALSFDPLAFTRMKPREQFDQLRQIAQVDLDVEKVDSLNKRDFEQRTLVNRDLKTAQAQLEALPAPGPEVQAVDLAALVERQQGLLAEQNRIQLAQQQRAGKERQAAGLRQELEQIRQTFTQKKAQLATLEEDLTNLFEELPPEALAEEVKAVAQDIRTAQQTNEASAEARRHEARRKELWEQVRDLETQAGALTESMEARSQAKMEAISRAKMPVPGLSLGEGRVIFNGVPFEQASSAEQLRVSVAVAIASNPKLRVIRIQDGSLLDDTSMQLLADMARENDMQVWIERVDASGQVGIVIEDGEVTADNQTEAFPPGPMSLETMDALRHGEQPLQDIEDRGGAPVVGVHPYAPTIPDLDA